MRRFPILKSLGQDTIWCCATSCTTLMGVSHHSSTRTRRLSPRRVAIVEWVPNEDRISPWSRHCADQRLLLLPGARTLYRSWRRADGCRFRSPGNTASTDAADTLGGTRAVRARRAPRRLLTNMAPLLIIAHQLGRGAPLRKSIGASRGTPRQRYAATLTALHRDAKRPVERVRCGSARASMRRRHSSRFQRGDGCSRRAEPSVAAHWRSDEPRRG